MGCKEVPSGPSIRSSNMRMCTYLVCILLWVCVPLANGAGFTPIVSRLQTEANFVRAAFEENAVVPSFGLEQLQLASNMLSNLWKHAEENIITVEKRTIPIPPTEKNENRRTKIPRGVSATNYVLNDCNIGKAHFSNESVNTCDNGLLCKVIEVLCTIDGSPVYIAAPVNGSVTNFNWSRCEVTKINCILDLNEDIEQMYDLREQYGASNCTPVPEATSCFSLFNRDPYPSCYVQLLCNDFLNIGYNSYGLKCESDELICGSTVITNLQSSTFGSHQSDVINGKCQLYKGGCVVPYNNNPTCTLFNYTCGFESYLGINRNNSCLLQRYDVPCAQQDSQSSNCIISQITCNGGITYDTSQPIPDQDHCFVSKITCDGNTVTVSPTNCVPTTMVCNGVEAYFSTYTGALFQCQMDQLTCPTQSNCTTLQFACPQAPKCQVNQLPCQVQCQQQLNTTTCICPDDRTGIKCQKEAPITCDANLFHPPINCLPSPLPDPNDKYLNGDRKCTVYDNYNAEADLGFMLNCHYDEDYSPNPENKQYNFTYWASNGNISFSNPVQWSLRQKIYNFNQLSDNNAVLVTPQLTASQLLGEEPVWFNFSLANIPDKYWLARRLYYEVDFNYSGYAPGSTSSRGFIDAPTRPISSAKMRKINVVALVFSLIGVLVFLGLVGYFGYKYYRFYRKKHPVSRN